MPRLALPARGAPLTPAEGPSSLGGVESWKSIAVQPEILVISRPIPPDGWSIHTKKAKIRAIDVDDPSSEPQNRFRHFK
ncbi:Hypothetical protein NTJ_15144 [Nesidiocoris tenuis]|uniref:Uncharacterized protein n=1 Tax=Nesidiocoris tenuis TaxID=355587 RepID=A0ABN7BD71_9HEMI|nr:Hypothetical protein NTJ_15144 [Nesidiocoris tenuis]